MPERGPRVVVTGGIGSGKSTVSGILGRLGAQVIDADRVGHEVLRDPEVVAAIQHRWPDVVDNGEVDRAALARIVFSDSNELSALEGMVHPRVLRRIEAVDREVRSSPLVVEMSAPRVLSANPWSERGWSVVVVSAPHELRRMRVLERGMEPADVDSRLSSQPPDEEWLEHADFVIDNSGSESDLVEATSRLASRLGIGEASSPVKNADASQRDD